MYDGDGEVAWPEHLHNFPSMIHEEDEISDQHASFFPSYTLRESPFCWVLSLSVDTMHSFAQFCDLIEDTFYHFDLDHLDQKLLQQRRARMNPLLIFGSTFVTCSFELQGAK